MMLRYAQTDFEANKKDANRHFRARE